MTTRPVKPAAIYGLGDDRASRYDRMTYCYLFWQLFLTQSAGFGGSPSIAIAGLQIRAGVVASSGSMVVAAIRSRRARQRLPPSATLPGLRFRRPTRQPAPNACASFLQAHNYSAE
jgi:hypothetical protein